MTVYDIPQHIAFIMDGNGRWAKKRLLPRKAGHKEGVEALKRVIDACEKRGVKAVSFYAFSTENWKRPKEEVDALFDMVRKFADTELTKYADKNVVVRFMGDISALPKATVDALDKISEKVSGNDGIIVNIGLNYGGRSEILRAFRKIAEEGGELTEENVSAHMYTAGLPDPDVVVRSSGEMRLSNFMLWQSAYAELIFVDDYWPDFDAKTIDRIIKIYNERNRRFGGLK